MRIYEICRPNFTVHGVKIQIFPKIFLIVASDMNFSTETVERRPIECSVLEASKLRGQPVHALSSTVRVLVVATTAVDETAVA